MTSRFNFIAPSLFIRDVMVSVGTIIGIKPPHPRIGWTLHAPKTGVSNGPSTEYIRFVVGNFTPSNADVLFVWLLSECLAD